MTPSLLPMATGAQDGPMTTPVAEAQESDDTGTETQESEDAAPTETVEAESAEPTETPTTEPDAQMGGVTAYIAEARSCPPGFDPSAGDAATALANCVQPLAGIAFTLGTQDPAYPGDTRTTGGDGIAAWADIPLGAGYSVSTPIPQGSGDPWVYCELTGGPGSDQYLYFPAGGGSMGIGLNDPGQTGYAQTFCRWFVPAAADASLAATPDTSQATGTGEVYLTNLLCPVNYDTGDMTLPALTAACTTPGAGVSFTLKATRGSPRSETTDAEGDLSWTGVPAGAVTIAESIPAGFRYAQPYCSTAPVGSGPGALESSLVQSDGKTISGTVAAGQALYCTLFNIAVPESTIAMLPFLCPSDYNSGDMTLGALTAGCSTAGTNIDYTVTTPAGTAQIGTTGSNGFLEFTGVPSGAVSIEESVPPGFLLAAVYCDPAPPQGEPDGSGWQSPPVTNNIISANVADRFTLNCYVFHIWAKGSAPASAGGYTLNLSTYLCPAGLTFGYATDVDANSSQCQGAAGWTYTHAGEGFSEEITTNPVGATTVSHAPAGPFTLTGSPQEGSRPEALWCSSNGGSLENLLGPGEREFAYTPAADEVLNCQWFDVSLYPAGTYVTLAFDARLCGATVPTTVVVEEWRTGCPNPLPGLTFEILQSDGSTVTGTSDAAGLVTVKVLPGNVYINEAQPDAYPGGYAWCGTEQAGSPPSYVNGGRLSPGDPGMPLTNVKPEYTYICQWFNASMDSPAKATTDGGEVTILKWRCPQGYDPTGATLDELRAACPTPQPGIEIGVFYASGNSFTAPTRLEKGPAIARFEDLPAGQVGIGEPGPNGQELERVFCKTGAASQPGLTLTDGYAEYPVAGGAIAATIEDGKVIECMFFNLPTGDMGDAPVTVTVQGRLCPADYGTVGASREDLLFNCTGSLTGVEFRVQAENGTYDLVQTTDASGSAVFDDVPVKPIVLSEQSPIYEAVAVFCGQATAPGELPSTYSDLNVVDESVRYEIQPGSDVLCYWIALDAPPVSVAVHKYACPEGYESHEDSFQTLLAKCPDPLKGVTFTLGGAATELSNVTDATGVAIWEGIWPGPLFITETPPKGTTGAVVFCGIGRNGGSPGGIAPVPVTQFAIERSVDGGDALECFWFDLSVHSKPDQPSPTATPTPTRTPVSTPTPGIGTPTPDPAAPARLVLTSYTCPVDFDLYDPEADLAKECDEAAEEIAFSLTALDGQTSPTHAEGATDENGVVIFAGLDAGPWLLIETLPDETQSAFLSSCESDRRDLQADPLFTPLTYIGPDGQIGVALIAGETLTCDAFTIPDTVEDAEAA